MNNIIYTLYYEKTDAPLKFERNDKISTHHKNPQSTPTASPVLNFTIGWKKMSEKHPFWHRLVERSAQTSFKSLGREKEELETETETETKR